jgi:antitoxin component HigA of HigAB toxin-antitoxin module
MECKHLTENEICTNVDCPCRADYCPCVYYTEICKFAEERVPEKKKIGERVRLLLDEENISMTRLARMCGINYSTMSRYLSGERQMKIELVAKIAKMLDTTLDYLVYGE